jgi:hypothetical protein
VAIDRSVIGAIGRDEVHVPSLPYLLTSIAMQV